jgi:hypothetical protein
LRAGGSSAREDGDGRTRGAGICVGALAFTAIQTVSLFTSPAHPVPFLRAFSAPAWGVMLTAPRFDAAVRAARTCPPGEAYGGPPLVALAAARSVPDDQPDQFLPDHSSTLTAARARIAAVQPVCPGPVSP